MKAALRHAFLFALVVTWTIPGIALANLPDPGCSWRPGFSTAAPDFPITAMAFFDDGEGPTFFAAEKVIGYQPNGTIAVTSYLRKWNGSSWQQVGPPIPNEIFVLSTFQGRLVAGGNFLMPGVANLGQWNGQTWQSLGASPNAEVRTLLELDGKLYAGGSFTEIGSLAARRIARWDGNQWNSLGGGANDDVFSLEVWNGSLIAAGQFNQISGIAARSVARFDGSSWSKLAGPDGVELAATVYDLEVLGSGSDSKLFAAGNFGILGTEENRSSVAYWDGNSWRAAGVVDSATHALAAVVDSTGQPSLYAAGGFHRAGEVVAHGFARFTENGWESLGNALIGEITHFLTPAGGGSTLWLFGSFTATPDGSQIARLARFDGAGFSSLGAGLDRLARTLEADDPDLLAGGAFLLAGGVSAPMVARFNGQRWFALGTGPGAEVRDLIRWPGVAGPEWIAATTQGLFRFTGTSWEKLANGSFYSLAGWHGELYAAAWQYIGVGERNLGALARWDGIRFEEVTGAPGGYLYSLVVGPDDKLYVGGAFSNSTYRNIARFDGNIWEGVGPGLNGSVAALAVYQDHVFAGGSFSRTGDDATLLGNIAEWNGSAWSSPGSGVNDSVATLASVELEAGKRILVAGGRFVKAGSLTVNRLAAWDGSTQTWHNFSQGLDGEVYSVAMLEGVERTLYVGGSFHFAGGIYSQYIARWVCPAPGAFDAAVTKTSLDLPQADAQHRYRIEVRGVGFSTARNVVLEDVFAPGKLRSCGWVVETGHEFGATDGQGELLRQTLTLPPGAFVSYQVTCQVPRDARGTLTNVAVASVPGESTPEDNVSVVSEAIKPPPTVPGDCDESTAVDSDDRSAFFAEIFDGDGRRSADVPGGNYPGHPIGCDANADQVVDAADLACLELLITGSACGESAEIDIPLLRLPNRLPVISQQALATFTLETTSSLRSVSFSVTYDPTVLSPPPNLVAAIQRFSLPAAVLLMANHVPAAHRIDVSITLPNDESLAQLPAGALIGIPFLVAPNYPSGTIKNRIQFVSDSYSFGDTRGRSLPGETVLLQDNFKTLILTHSGRLAQFPELGFSDPPSGLVELRQKLQRFASHPLVLGLNVDLAAYAPQLDPLYDSWNPGGNTATVANQVLLAPRGLLTILSDLLAAFPGIQYLLIVGDDRIVPMARIANQTALSEATYSLLPEGSTVAQALANNYYLSDGPLATASLLAANRAIYDNWTLVLPKLSAGRLVEGKAEIFRALDLFAELDGVVDLETYDPNRRQVATTGYDFLLGSANEIGDLWTQRLGPNAVDRLVGDFWDASALADILTGRDQLGQARVLNVEGHANHFQIGVPTSNDGNAGLSSDELYGQTCANSPAAGLDLGGAMAFGMSCHGGLAVPGQCEDGSNHTFDLPQAFLASRAIAYGDNSGFGWGTVIGSGLGERFLIDLHRRLGGELGIAIRNAKLAYYRGSAIFDAYDRKTLQQWTLYGFPMARLTSAPVSSQPTDENLQFSAPDPGGVEYAEAAGVAIRRKVDRTTDLGRSLPDHMERATIELDFSASEIYEKFDANGEPSSSQCQPSGCYFRLNGLVSDENDLPMQPFFNYAGELANTVAKDGLWMGGQYRVESPWYPIFSQLQSIDPVPPLDPAALPSHIYIRPRGNSGGEPLPDGRIGCGQILGQSAAIGNISMVTGELIRVAENPVAWEERLFTTADFELFYLSHSSPDCTAPRIDSASATALAGTLTFKVVASDLEPDGNPGSGVWRVVVVWDNTALRRYEPVELSLAPDGTFQGSIEVGPAGQTLYYYVQVVDREGNTTFSSRSIETPSGIPLELASAHEVTIQAVDGDFSLRHPQLAIGTRPGAIVSIPVTVLNSGTAAPVQVSWQIPTGFTFVSAGPAPWTCGTQSASLECRRAVLGGGETSEVFVSLLAPPTSSSASHNFCSEVLNDNDHPEGNQACTEIRVLDTSMTDLWITGSLAVSGDQASFTFDVYNTDNPVTGAKVELSLAPSLTNATWTCTAAAGDLCHGGTASVSPIVIRDTVNLGAQHHLHYEGTATFQSSPSTPGPVRILAKVTLPAGMTDYRPENNSFEAIAEGWIFADGFESGDLRGWDLVVP